jgi:hypothetical protein
MRGCWPTFLVTLLLTLGPAGRALALGGKMMVAVIDQVTWADLEAAQAPTLRRLAAEGGIGLMSVRTSGRGGGYLTIGAGTRASASPWRDRAYPEGWAFQVGELVEEQSAGRLFRSYTGWPIGDNAIVHLSIGGLIRENMSAPYLLSLGLLGGTLRRAGLHVACVGNADTQSAPHRELVAIGMDGQGLLELGDVSSDLVRRQADLPYGLTTDSGRLLAAFHRIAARADLVVVDFGETSRVAEYAELMPPGAARAARLRAIQRADRLLGQMIGILPPSDWAAMVIVPNARPPDPDEQFASLTPVILRLPEAGPGLLTSPSTRRAGVVVNTDVAPTILGYFGLQTPPEMVGREMGVEPVGENALERLRRELAWENEAELIRRYAFRWLPVLGAVGLWASATLFLLGDRGPGWARALVRGLLLLLLSTPVALLLIALGPLPLWAAVEAIVAISVALALLGSWVTSWRSGQALPAVALVGLLSYSLARSPALLQCSPLSYSAAAGARFYGIGNEYGGALLGAALIAAASLLSRRERCTWGERVVASAGLLAVAALVGHPRFGANLGVALACAVGFGVFIVYLWREQPSWGDVGLVLVVAGLLVGAAVAVDIAARGTEASHIGRLVGAVRAQGWSALGQVIARKWAMNWALVRASLWTDMAVAALACIGVWLLARPRAAWAAIARPWFRQSLIACGVGAAAAWVLNDSGIVAAALALLYGVGSLSYAGLGEALQQA